MTDSENPISKERIEEISVTEVSDQVLQELTGLFGGREPEIVAEPGEAVDPSDMTVTDVVDLADVVAEDNTPQDKELPEEENIVIVDRDADQ